MDEAQSSAVTAKMAVDALIADNDIDQNRLPEISQHLLVAASEVHCQMGRVCFVWTDLPDGGFTWRTCQPDCPAVHKQLLIRGLPKKPLGA